MTSHAPVFHLLDAVPPIVIAAIFIAGASLLREPGRRHFNTVMVAGAGAAYLSGGFGVWEFAFTTLMTFVAYKGLQSYAFLGAGFVVVLCGEMQRMPGLGRTPAFMRMDIDADGRTTGLT